MYTLTLLVVITMELATGLQQGKDGLATAMNKTTIYSIAYTRAVCLAERL